VTFLQELPRQWVTINLPGVGERHPSTYVAFDRFPAAPADVDLFKWLREAGPRQGSALATTDESAKVDISMFELHAMVGDAAPSDLVDFISNPELRTHLPSATDAYFDLGDQVRDVDGGRLLHLVSDSQWVMHWSIYIGDDGVSAIVASNYPVGFHLGIDDLDYWSSSPIRYYLCAASFGEFAWRWWMDNETFYRNTVDNLPLTRDQDDYLAEYGDPRQLD
jgi:hypothetical protein